MDANQFRFSEFPKQQREEAAQKKSQLGAGSMAEVIRLMRDRSETAERREAAAFVLGGFKCRDAVEPLIDVLAEGHQRLSWMCMWALTRIGSRRHARKLIDIARGNYPLPARQQAIYTLHHLNEVRAEQLFIQLSAALGSEEEYTRDMATEALGNTSRRLRSQRALAAQLLGRSAKGLVLT